MKKAWKSPPKKGGKLKGYYWSFVIELKNDARKAENDKHEESF